MPVVHLPSPGALIQMGIHPEAIRLRPLVTAPEAGLNPMPVATERKQKAVALEAGALNKIRAGCRLHQNREMEA